MKYLSSFFLSSYPDQPEHMNELGAFVYYRTYSRWLPDKGRRETWKETVARSVEYNISLAEDSYTLQGIDVPVLKLKEEAEQLFDNIFNLRQALSGRTHWVGGAEGGVAEKFPLANFNCSFTNIEAWEDLAELFYLLLVGTGVGFKCTKEMAQSLPPIRTDFTLTHSPYNPVPKEQRLENTKLEVMENGYAKIYVGDSKEGWVQALTMFLQLLYRAEYEHVHSIKVSYNSIRPKGERLVTFGGTASGYEPLMEMFDGFKKVLNNEIDPHLAPLEVSENTTYKHARPIHILDMGNLIGNNVVVGGVRRTAEIFLCDADDWECILAKYGINGIWNEEQHQNVINAMSDITEVPEWMYEIQGNDANARPLHHRRMSNNSVAFIEKPSREMLHLLILLQKGEGEPGFINLYEAARRRLAQIGVTDEETIEKYAKKIGLNPCAEILLFSKGVCNLTTTNVDAFVFWNGTEWELDLIGLINAQRLSTRAGMRMTRVRLELYEWDVVQQRDALIGPSLTGWKDALAKLGFNDQMEAWLLNELNIAAKQECIHYSKELRMQQPLLDTTVKPEGTLSQVFGGVSSGLHKSKYAPYYIRRIRINSSDPLARVAIDLGWSVHPEVGTEGETYEEKMSNARTYVIDFPVYNGGEEVEENVHEQFDTYFRFQRYYTSHNSSNTISVRPDEWDDVEAIVWDNWDKFVGVSFLAHDGGSYELAPYEKIDKETYDTLRERMKPFDRELLRKYEIDELGSDLDGADACTTGACPIR